MVRPAGRPLGETPKGADVIPIKFLVDPEMDSAVRERVRALKRTRAEYLRKLVERDLKAAKRKR
jgi:hypothetical protein